jgi:asparagine synthase (glutamine-hydrolysing)
MGIIGGIYNTDGQPVCPEALKALLHRVSLVRQDKEGTYVSGNIGLGSRQIDSTPESRIEKQPVHSEVRSCYVVLDGRIDNRRALIRDLEITGDCEESITDAELILRAYEAWGTGCAQRTIGHFAFAIWDNERSRLLCVTDAIGVRPIFYIETERQFVFSSQIGQLLGDPALPSPDLNEEYLADFLACGLSLRGMTPFKGIKRLPAGHVLIVENGDVRLEKYWDLEEKKIYYDSQEEYDEQFLALFRESVEHCLRADAPVWSDLSGGLDSSSIVCMAQEIRSQSGRKKNGFSTVTVVYDEAAKSDEREWSRAAIDKYSLDARQISGDVFCAFKESLAGASYWDEPHGQILFYSTFKRYAEMLEQAGANILLTGVCAEAALLVEDPEPIHLADLLRTVQLRKLGGELSAWQKSMKVPLLNVLIYCCLKPLLYPTLRIYMPRRWTAAPSWVTSSFARRYDLAGRQNHGFMPLKFKSPADQWQYELVKRSPWFLVRGYLERACDIRYPFLFQPLVEFSMAVPWERRIRPGIDKYLLRQAMAGILPDKIRRRGGKRGPGHSVYLSVAKYWKEIEPLIQSPYLSSLGIVDQKDLYRVTELARHGHAQHLVMLMWTLSLELWLRSLQNRNLP